MLNRSVRSLYSLVEVPAPFSGYSKCYPIHQDQLLWLASSLSGVFCNRENIWKAVCPDSLGYFPRQLGLACLQFSTQAMRAHSRRFF